MRVMIAGEGVYKGSLKSLIYTPIYYVIFLASSRHRADSIRLGWHHLERLIVFCWSMALQEVYWEMSRETERARVPSRTCKLTYTSNLFGKLSNLVTLRLHVDLKELLH